MRAEDLQPPPEESQAVAAAYDSTSFADQFILQLSDGTAELNWAIGGMHCAACVWLLEQLPQVCPGVVSARTNFSDNSLRVHYDPNLVRPSEQALAIGQLGYRAAPPNTIARQQLQRHEKRQLFLRTALSAAAAMGTMHIAVGLLAAEQTGSMEPAARQFYGLMSAFVALPALIYGAWPFYRGAIQGMYLGRVGMDASVVVVLAIGSVISVINMFRASTAIYFDALAMFVALLLAGRVVLLLTKEAVHRRSQSSSTVLPLVVRSGDLVAEATTDESVADNWISTDHIVPGSACVYWLGDAGSGC